MQFIQKYSYSCSNYLMKRLGENHEKRRVYYFGFQVVFGAIVKGITLVTLAFLCGALLPTLIIALVFGILRNAAGGYHMDTYGKCITTSTGLFLLPGILAQYTYSYWDAWHLFTLTALTFINCMIAAVLYAPADTPNRPITSPEEIRKFKNFSLAYVSGWTIISAVLILLGFKLAAIAVCFGVLMEMFTITPAGHNFLKKLSDLMDKIIDAKK